MALWDIKDGRRGCPSINCWRQVPRGGRLLRPRLGGDNAQVIENVKSYMARGFRHVRVQIGSPHGLLWLGRRGTGGESSRAPFRAGLRAGRQHTADAQHAGGLPQRVGDEVELLHDVHERISPTQGLQFAKDVEKFKLFFLEDCSPRKTSAGSA